MQNSLLMSSIFQPDEFGCRQAFTLPCQPWGQLVIRHLPSRFSALLRLSGDPLEGDGALATQPLQVLLQQLRCLIFSLEFIRVDLIPFRPHTSPGGSTLKLVLLDRYHLHIPVPRPTPNRYSHGAVLDFIELPVQNSRFKKGSRGWTGTRMI